MALTKAKPLLKSALALGIEGETGTLSPLAHRSLLAIAFSILASGWEVPGFAGKSQAGESMPAEVNVQFHCQLAVCLWKVPVLSL